MKTRYIDQPSMQARPANNDSLWQVMKPFVKFGAKTMGIMAGALWAIIKIIPKPSEFNQKQH